MSVFDDLTAGEEAEQMNQMLETISEQLERLGGGESAEQGVGHIAVPGDFPQIAVPSGRVTVNLEEGTVAHEDVGVLRDDLTTIGDLFDDPTTSTPRQIRNIVFNADTVATVKLKQGDQRVPLQYVPLPTESVSEIEIGMGAPGEFFLLASTQELPIGLGAVTATAQRYGAVQGTLDSLTAVPVAPHRLISEFGESVAESRVYSSTFDTTTVTIDNESGNGSDLRAVVEARESGSPLSEFREIASETIPDGDHSIFNVTQRHNQLRVRVTNTTDGEQIAAKTEYHLANP